MIDSYLTLEELKAKNFQQWDSCLDGYAEDKLVVASAVVDQLFLEHGTTVEEAIENGRTNDIMLKEVIAQMVLGLIAYQKTTGGLPVSQVTDRGGDYQVSIMLPPSLQRSSIRVLPEEMRLLGLPSSSIKIESIIPGIEN